MIVASELNLEGISHGFFSRKGGVSKGIYEGLNIGLGSSDHPAHVQENRARAAERFALPVDRLVTAHQIHSADVLTVSRPFAEGEDRRADGLVTDRPDLILGIATADCGPVLFADPGAGVIGAAHAGWKGAIGGILENTLAAMEALGANRANVVAVLGPTISATAYEVGPEFRARFAEEDEAYLRFFSPSARETHFMFDLPNFIVHRLEAAGAGTALSLDRCTYAGEEEFYSYRRSTHRSEPDYGRLLSAIALTSPSPA
ncbi:peptidoglycan editing factor PgeF [Roseibium aestuarii]|uniref:Purine nucleoside phosphorylase n=1 Tax=Roseibium aestuarii TaxID=2600299 RepID=A0ABW4JWM2_9HYPH|nr:peptidoglycan editing factor PgeF [Roseibium aestuarii]